MISALMELLDKRDLAQITPSDVIALAGVSRSTFYDHFKDLRDLATIACTSQFDALLAAAPVSSLEDMSELPIRLIPFFRHVQENRRLYLSLLGADGSAYVAAHLHDRLAAAIRGSDALSATAAHSAAVSTMSQARASFLAGGLAAVARTWLEEDSRESAEEIAAEVAATVLGASHTRHS
ncbi:hypothetical protein BH11ACT4_BH11ACT4_25540 [soil metagenome]